MRHQSPFRPRAARARAGLVRLLHGDDCAGECRGHDQSSLWRRRQRRGAADQRLRRTAQQRQCRGQRERLVRAIRVGRRHHLGRRPADAPDGLDSRRRLLPRPARRRRRYAGPLPTPDAIGTTALSATAGKVALVDTTTPLTGSCPISDARVVDFVGYGAAASCAETAPAAAPSSTTAVIRASAGNSCLDSGNNSADFAALAPMPRNSGAVIQPCRGGGGQTPLDAKIYEIQGSGAKSPLVGKLVNTTASSRASTTTASSCRTRSATTNPATSDGIFVFTGSAPTRVGRPARSLTATVAEFNTGAAATRDTAAHTASPS